MEIVIHAIFNAQKIIFKGFKDQTKHRFSEVFFKCIGDWSIGIGVIMDFTQESKGNFDNLRKTMIFKIHNMSAKSTKGMRFFSKKVFILCRDRGFFVELHILNQSFKDFDPNQGSNIKVIKEL